MTIPKGYVLIPEQDYRRFQSVMDFKLSETPDIVQVSEYVGVSTQKIKKDILKDGCPLKVAYAGTKGRSGRTKYFRESVEQYKTWIKK